MTDNHSGFTTSAGEHCIVEGCVVVDGEHRIGDVPRIPVVAAKHAELTELNDESKARAEAGAPSAPPKRKRRTKAEMEAARAEALADPERYTRGQKSDVAMTLQEIVDNQEALADKFEHEFEPVNPEPVVIRPARPKMASDDEDIDPVELVPGSSIEDPADEVFGGADLLDVIRAGMQERERAPMGNIGPSMLGGCERKMGYQLAFGSDGARDDDSWIATIGTAGHAWLDDVIKRQVEPDGTRRWYGSKWITVPVRGVIDVYDAHRREIVDFKIVGATTLGKARKGEIDRKYDVQLDVYGVGMIAAGYHVERVAALFLPKTQGLGKAVWYSRPLDVGRAVKAVENLRRVEAIIGAAKIADESGLAYGPTYQSALDTLTPTEDFCGSCPALRAGYCKGVVKVERMPEWPAYDAILEGMEKAA